MNFSLRYTFLVPVGFSVLLRQIHEVTRFFPNLVDAPRPQINAIFFIGYFLANFRGYLCLSYNQYAIFFLLTRDARTNLRGAICRRLRVCHRFRVALPRFVAVRLIGES